MPCLIRNDGVVFPFDPNLAQDPRFKYSEHLPAEHVKTIKRVKAREERQAKEFELQKAELKAQEEQTAQERRDALRKSLEIPEPGAAEEAAQAEVDSHTKEFVISKADKKGLTQFAKTQYGVDLDQRLSLPNMRAEVAKLAGVEQAA